MKIIRSTLNYFHFLVRLNTKYNGTKKALLGPDRCPGIEKPGRIRL